MSKNKFIFSICLITATNLFANLENKNTNETIINETPITSTNTLEIKEIEPTFEELISIDLKNELKLNQKLLFTTNKYLRTYYKQNNYLPFWFDEKGIKEVSLTLLDSIKNDPVIEPHATKAFKLEKILDALSNIDKSPENYNKSMIQIDFMLTEIYDRYMRYLSKGTINWRKFQRRLNELKKNDILADWEKFNVKTDSKKLLIEAINKNDLNIAFSQVNFTYPNSDKLISEIDKLEEILENGDYVKIPNFKKV